MYLRPFKSTALVVVMAAITWGVPAVAESVSASSVTAQSSECAPGVTPNVVGQITDVDGLPYSTRVRLRGSAVANPTFQVGELLLGETASDANGNYGFCFDLFGNPDVNALQIIGFSKSADYERQGHSGSPFVQSFDCSVSCEISVQLAEPTVIFDFEESIDRVEQYVSISGQLLHIGPLDSENRGSFAFRDFTPGISLRLKVFPTDISLFPFNEVVEYSGTPIRVTGPLARADISGRIKKETGEYLSDPDVNPTQAYLVRLHGDGCSQGMAPLDLYFAGCVSNLNFTGVGTFASALASEGLWSISLSGEGFAATTVYFTNLNGGIQPLGGPLEVAVGNQVIITLSLGALKFVVQDSQGNDAPNASITVASQTQEGTFADLTYGGPAKLSDGRYGWTPSTGGIYRFRISGVTTSDSYLAIGTNNDGQLAVLNACTHDVSGPTTTCSDPAPERDEQGSWVLTLLPGDIGFQICGPATENQACGSLGVEPYVVQRTTVLLSESGEYERDFENLDLWQSSIQLVLPDPVSGGTVYRFRFQASWQNSNRWATIPFVDVRLNEDGSLDRCGAPEVGVLCSSPTPLAISGGVATWPNTLHFGVGNFQGRVVRGDCTSNCEVSNASVQVYAGPGAFRSNESSSSAGRFSSHLPEGSYTIKASPNWQASNDGYTDALIRVVIGSSGEVVSVDGVTYSGNGDIDIVLPAANVNGRLLKDGQPVARSWIMTEQWVDALGRFEVRPSHPFTDLDGSFKTSLGDGIWRLTAYPDESLTSYSKDQIVVRVTSGSISQAGPCVLDPAQACTNVADGIVLSYRFANLRGVVRRVDPSNQSLVPVAFSGVGVRIFDSSAGYYRWLEGGSTQSTGSFGFKVEPGRYLLDISKPSGVTGASSTAVYVVVTEDGMCEAESTSQATCPSTVDSLDITLPSPNLTGTVEAGGNGKRAFIRVVQWVDGRWNWEKATFDRSSLPNGNFEMSLDDGQYQMIVEPDAASSSGLSQTLKYVEVSGNTWCSFEPVGEAPPATGQCPSMGSGPLVVELPASNYSGVVVDVSNGGSTPVRFGRVEVFRVYGQNDAFSEFLQSSNISYNGQFDLRIEYPDSGPNTVDVIDLVVHPDASGANTLARKKIRMWLGRFTGDAEKDDLCLVEPVNGSCDNNNLVTDSQTIQVNAGNLRGSVVRPGSGSAVGFSGVQVERIDGGGSATDRYRWINVGSSGSFSTSLEEGEWRLTARPPRGESTLSAGSIDIHVKGDLTWCTLESFNTVGAQCATPSPFQIALTVPNVTSRVMNGSSGQRDVWVNVEIRRTVGNNSWWEWVSVGASTGTNGDFALSLPDGAYRLAVNPPFGNSQSLVRFTREFTVTAGVSNLPDQLSYPTANLVRTIRDPNGATVPRAWVYVEQLVGGNWQWADMNGETSAAGVISLNIAWSGRYRLVVNPPNGRVDLARFTQEFEVTVQNNSLTFVGTALPDALAFSRPNISGSVTTDGTDLSRNGWVEVFELDGSWVTGSGTGEGGSFALLAPAPMSGTKTYTVRLHPNYQSAVRSPIDVRVTIDATGAITKWWYASDAAEVDRCVSTPCSMSVNMSFDPPNVALRVETTGNQAIEGAFVQFEALTGTGGSPTGVVFETVSDENGEASLRLPFPNNGTTYYNVTVVRVDGDNVSTDVREISVDGSTSTGNPLVVQF